MVKVYFANARNCACVKGVSMKRFPSAFSIIALLLAFNSLFGCAGNREREVNERKDLPDQSLTNNDEMIEKYSREMIDQGRKVFRYDTFGSEKFWGDQLQLHKAIAGKQHGGVGDGLTPNM